MENNPKHTPSWHSDRYYKRHPEARLAKAIAPVEAEPTTPRVLPERKKRSRENPAVAYLNRIGGGLSLVSIVSTFQFPSVYWYGVVAFYAGVGALAVGALLERWSLRYRIAVCLLWASVATCISVKAVFVKAPLDISPSSNSGNYPDDTDVYGIKWERGLSEMRILISNHTANDYDDMDIYFTPDVPTHKVTQVSNVPEVSLVLVEPSNFSSPGHVSELWASSMGFRLRCPKLPKNTTMEVLAALVNPDAKPLGPAVPGQKKNVSISLMGDEKQFAGPKIVAHGLWVKGQYLVLNRPVPLEYKMVSP